MSHTNKALFDGLIRAMSFRAAIVLKITLFKKDYIELIRVNRLSNSIE